MVYQQENVVFGLGDLYDEQQILSWLITQKDPAGEVIEAYEGEELVGFIKQSDSLAVYFCKYYVLSHYFKEHTT